MIYNMRSVISVFLFTTLSMIISSCGGSGKIKPLIDFTPKLQSEISSYNVIVSQSQAPKVWDVSANWINVQPQNFHLASDIGSKFKHAFAFKKLIATPLSVDGKIILLSENGVVSAFDKTSNKLIWSKSLVLHNGSNDFMAGGMVVDNGVLFVTYGTRDLVAVDISDGQELWRKQFPDILKAQPVVSKGMLLAITISNQICAMNLSSGSIIWEHEGLPETLSYGHNIAPVIFEDKVLVGYSSGQLVLLDLVSGNEIWQLNLAKNIDALAGFVPLGLNNQPIIDKDFAYISTASGKLIKINLHNGAVYWERDIKDIQSMNQFGNILCITTNAKQVAAISIDNGSVVWARDLDISNKKQSNKPIQLMIPIMIDGQVISITSDGKLYKIDISDGSIVQTISIDSDAKFLVVDEMLRIFTKNHMLVSAR